MKQEIKFSYYKAPITNNIPSESIDLNQLFKAIKGAAYKERTEKYRKISDPEKASEFKTTQFDYVTVSGVFSKRKDDAIIEHSGYMVLDIDKQNDISAIKERLIHDPELDPLMIFTSPSNKGLKVIIAYDLALVEDAQSGSKLTKIWDAVNNYFAKNYSEVIIPDDKGNFIDPSGRDLSRACFICYDETIFINNKIYNND